MNKSRRDFIRSTGLVGLGAAIASGPFSSRAWAAEAIPLGWVGPLSPPGNYSGGQEMKWAVQLKADEINGAGGIHGRPVEVFYEDTKGQPAEGSAAAVRLITQITSLPCSANSTVRWRWPRSTSRTNTACLGSAPMCGPTRSPRLQYPEVFRVSPANSLIYLEGGELDRGSRLQACCDPGGELRLRPGRRERCRRHLQATRRGP